MATVLDIGTDGSVTTYQEEGNKIHLVTHHPDTASLEKLNAEQMASRGRFDKKGDFHHVMRIPQSILTKICADTGLDFFQADDAKEILNILKQPDYAKFRTYSGKI